MKTMFERIGTFVGDESGSPAIEYPLVAAAVAMMLIAALGVVGGGLTGLLGATADAANASLVNAGSSLL